MRRKLKSLRLQPNLLAVLVVIGAGLTGSYLINLSSAATNNVPTGGIDRCALVNGTTVLYGWSYDPNEPKTGSRQAYATIKVGTVTKANIPSSIAKYRDAPINAYITKVYGASYPHPGTYGWSIGFTGFYKGGSYAVSGVAINYGAGTTNKTLGLNGANTLDGKATTGFPGGKIPDACMPAKPATPAPAPAPAPSPEPDADSGSDPAAGDESDDNGDAADSGGGDDEEQAGSTDDAEPAAPKPSAAADATPDTGTVTASLKVPAGNASKIHIVYGSDATKLDQKTDDVDADDPTDVSIENLSALTTYTYQIVRTGEDGTAVNSAPATFKTKGYLINLKFVNGSKAIAGIQGELDNETKTKATSDKNGAMNFSDLPSGVYTVSFTYEGKKHTSTLDTNSATVNSGDSEEDTGQQTAVLSDTIDVSKLDDAANGNADAANNKKANPIVWLLPLLLVIVGVIVFVLRRRRKQAASSGLLPAPYNPAGSNQDIIDQQMTQHFNANPVAQPPSTTTPPPMPEPKLVIPSNTVTPSTVQPGASHAGESLRDMVLRSMHEEAVKRNNDDTQGPGPTNA